MKLFDPINMTYTLKDLENKLNIKSQTLRNWEKRYQLIHPSRNKTNCRTYSKEQFEFLKHILILKDHGYKISDIAQLSFEEITAQSKHIQSDSQKKENYIELIINYTLSFDYGKLEQILDRIFSLYDMKAVIQEILVPIFYRLNILWLTGSFYITHERMLGQLIKRKVLIELSKIPNRQRHYKPTSLLFSPDADQKSYMSYLVQYLLEVQNIPIMNMGSDVTPEEIGHSIHKMKIDRIYILITEDFVNVSADYWLKHINSIFTDIPVSVIFHPPIKTNLSPPETIRIHQGFMALHDAI